MSGFLMPETPVSAPFSGATCSQAQSIIFMKTGFIPSKYPHPSKNLSAISNITIRLKTPILQGFCGFEFFAFRM
jgi:hypothetical protein